MKLSVIVPNNTAKTLNILFVLDKFPSIDGVVTVTTILSNEFTKRGHNVHIIGPIQMPFQKLCNVQFLHNLIMEKNIDILINQVDQMEYVYLCSKARKGTNVKFIQVHHFNFFRMLNKRMSFRAKIFPEFLSKKIKKFIQVMEHKIKEDLSDRYIFLSESYVREFLKYGESDKILAIANPINLKVTEQKKENIILFVARMEESQKQPSLVLSVWKIICNKYPNWNLKFVGDGKDLVALKEKAKDLPRVSFEGAKNSKPYFEKAKILLQTSVKDFEGFGMTLVEAMVNSCVPIAMDSYLSLADIIKNGENGFIVQYNNTEEMAHKIEMLINDENLMLKMVQNGKESCKKFEVSIIVDKWEKLFEELRGGICRE